MKSILSCEMLGGTTGSGASSNLTMLTRKMIRSARGTVEEVPLWYLCRRKVPAYASIHLARLCLWRRKPRGRAVLHLQLLHLLLHRLLSARAPHLRTT